MSVTTHVDSYEQLPCYFPHETSVRRAYLEWLWVKWSYLDDDSLLVQTFIHKSYAADYPFHVPFNERMEFLGDSILWATIAQALYRDFPNHKESQLTLSKIWLVKESTLASVARTIDLWSQMWLWNGELKTWWTDKDSVLSDWLEAIIGYLSLVAPYKTVAEFVETHIYTLLETMPLPTKTFKSKLQEAVQKKWKTVPVYETTVHEQERSWNVLMYKAVVFIDNRPEWTWYGKNKKLAHEAAAKQAYLLFWS